METPSVTRAIEILNEKKNSQYYSVIANVHVAAFIDTFNANIKIPKNSVFSSISVLPVIDPSIALLTRDSVSLDRRAAESELYTKGFNGNPSERGAMSMLIAGELADRELTVPIGIRNIMYYPAGDEKLSKWQYLLKKSNGEVGSGPYIGITGKGNGLFIGGWTFLFNNLETVRKQMRSLGTVVDSSITNQNIRGQFGIGNAITKATHSVFATLQENRMYPQETAIVIERMGVLSPIMPEVVTGKKVFRVDEILGLNLKQDTALQQLNDFKEFMDRDISILTDFEQRLRKRYQTVLENLGIDDTDISIYMEEQFNITNLLGVGHPCSNRATKNAQRLNLQTMPGYAHYISGGPLYQGVLGEVDVTPFGSAEAN
jgi:hypothetical protein